MFMIRLGLRSGRPPGRFHVPPFVDTVTAASDRGETVREEVYTMANYVLIYHGGSMPETPEEGAKVMQAWTDWFAVLGDAVVDGGNPASATKRIAPDGSVTDDAAGPTGYSILKAESLDAAVELAKGCPVLSDGSTVQVVETFEAM